MQCWAFGAKPPKIRRVFNITFYANDFIALRANNHATTHATIGAGAFGFFQFFYVNHAWFFNAKILIIGL